MECVSKQEKLLTFRTRLTCSLLLSDSILKPINKFRQQILGLMSISPVTAGRLMADHELPHTYFCSKVLVPRPNDWSSNHGRSCCCYRPLSGVLEADESHRDFGLLIRAT